MAVHTSTVKSENSGRKTPRTPLSDSLAALFCPTVSTVQPGLQPTIPSLRLFSAFFAPSSDDSAADPNVHSDRTIARAQQTGMAKHSQSDFKGHSGGGSTLTLNFMTTS